MLTVDENAFCDNMKCIYWLAKHEIAHSHFTSLLDFCVLMGNDTLPMLEKARNLNYRSEQTKAEILTCIGSALEEDLLERVSKSPYYSIIFDEATDITVHKQLGVCIQYIDQQSACVQVQFLKLLELSQGTADVICDAIIKYISEYASINLDLEKLAGGATDGASVMVGSLSGVVTRIKRIVPKFISTHCSAHRLQLAACDAADSTSTIKQFQCIVNQVYVFFSRSTNRSAQLQEMEKVYNQPSVTVKQPTETRWLSCEAAVNSLRKCLSSVKAVCEQEAIKGDATALGLATQISKSNFIALLLFMSDLLSLLANLSRCLQVSTLNLLSVEQHVQDTIASLKSLQENVFSSSYMSTLDVTLQSMEVTDNLDKSHIDNIAKEYISKLITNLQERFPEVHLLSLLGYFDPRNVEKATLLSMLELGEYLGIDGHQLWLEFSTYKIFVKRLPQQSIHSAMQAMYTPDVKDNMIVAYPLISDILARISVLPGSSAEAERVFSTMKRIKTPIRNRLKTSTVDNLVRISMVGPSISEWDPIPSLRKWERMGKRKITSSQTQKH